MKPVISPAEVLDRMKDPDTVIIDARSGPDAFERYLKGHLTGAVHVDLDKDLSQKPDDPAYGGRHPLPDHEGFAVLLGRLGITPSKQVLVYDDKSGANAAARFWWMLKSAGHSKVQVIDGGLDGITAAGLPLDSVITTRETAPPYPLKDWLSATVDIEAVEKARNNDAFAIIDVREGYRYRGEREPIDLVAGHIPGAINIPYLENLDGQGYFRPSNELEALYRQALHNIDNANVIVHCGSGVTACHTLLALEQAGLAGAKLYVGSWSEWSRRAKEIG